MKSYKATFMKSDGKLRTMKFIRLSDLPGDFLNEKIKELKDENKEKPKKGKELVWCLDNSGFRFFNWDTVQGEVTIFQSNTL